MVNKRQILNFKETFYETSCLFVYVLSDCIDYSVRRLSSTAEDVFIERWIDGLEDNDIDYLYALLQDGEIENIFNLFRASSEYEKHFDDSPDGSAADATTFETMFLLANTATCPIDQCIWPLTEADLTKKRKWLDSRTPAQREEMLCGFGMYQFDVFFL